MQSITTGDHLQTNCMLNWNFINFFLVRIHFDFLRLNFARKLESYKLCLQNGNRNNYFISIYHHNPFIGHVKYHCIDRNHSNWKQSNINRNFSRNLNTNEWSTIVFNCCGCYINSDQLEIDQIIVAEIEFVSNRFSPNGKLFKKMHNKETTQKPLIHRQAIFMKSNLHSAGVGKTWRFDVFTEH